MAVSAQRTRRQPARRRELASWFQVTFDVSEAFNGRLRDECLNVHQFTSIEDAQAKIEAWRVDYNARRPHSSLGHLTPNEFFAQRQAMRTAEDVASP